MAIVWNETMFRKWYALPNQPYGQGGAYTTYSRIGFRYFRGPELEWLAEGFPEFPDHPMNEYRWRVERLVALLGIQPSHRIIVLGCGLGFLPETFIWWKMRNGIAQATAQSQVVGVDNSQFIQGNVAAEAHALMQGRIVNRSLLDGTTTAGMRNALRTLAGGSEFFDWVITESVIESYTDAERPNFLTACESYQRNTGATTKNLARVVHFVFDVLTEPDGTPQPSQSWDPVPDGGAPNRTLAAWAQTRPQNSWVSAYGSLSAIVGTG